MNEPSLDQRLKAVEKDPAGRASSHAVAFMPPKPDDIDDIKSAVLAKLALETGKDTSNAKDRDWFVAAALTIRDRIVHRWLASERLSQAQGRKHVYYLSLEFL